MYKKLNTIIYTTSDFGGKLNEIKPKKTSSDTRSDFEEFIGFSNIFLNDPTEKAENIRNLGMDPFGQKFERKDFASDIKEKYESIDHEEFENMTDTATVAGRIMFIRKMGKASFFSIQDKEGFIQIYIRKDVVGEDMYASLLNDINSADKYIFYICLRQRQLYLR